MLKGIAVSAGIALGQVYKLEEPNIDIEVSSEGVEKELKKFEDAIVKTSQDITQVRQVASTNLSEEELAIFDAHLQMVEDPEFSAQIKEKIESGLSAVCATKEVSKMTIDMFLSMDNEYFKERAADVKDVSYRLICNLLGLNIPNLSTISSEVIIVANDLTPSDTAQLNKKYTLGFVTEIGGRTSHSAIMARSLEIPAVVGVGQQLKDVKDGQFIILDAIKGEIITNPSNQQIKEYEDKRNQFLKEKEELKILISEKSVTIDGHEVEIAANIGTPKDVSGVIENGAEGVGLYRTEFLYMDSQNDFPSEEVQFEAYKTVLESMQGQKVVVRTLDIGGDKKLDYFKFPEEMNPFLGYRAIRLCLDRHDIFRTQLRALLRASIYGKLCIMFPMIATIEEFLKAKALFLEEKANLEKQGHKVSQTIQLGMMVEIPAAAVLAKQFAKHADFFSIGTNDLIQYSMAADRMSEKVAYLYQPLNPSILNLIKLTIDGAHSQGKWVGMCGEMASDPYATPILLGLGLDEFSMSSSAILTTRKAIRNLSFKQCQDLASEALEKNSCEEVVELVSKFME